MRTTVMTREQAKQFAIKEIKKNIEKYGADAISVACPMPGKNSWTWQEELDAVLNDTIPQGRDTSVVDDMIALDKYLLEMGKPGLPIED